MNTKLLEAFAAVPVWAIDERALRAALHAESLAERKARAAVQVVNGVALIPVTGVLVPHETALGDYFGGEMPADAVRLMLRAALADDRVSTITLVIDSPGGDVSGVPELADELFAARAQKPVVAHVRYLAASGAYWLASQADAIWSEPSGEVGSIGVFTAHASYQKMLEDDGIDVTLIRAGKFKAEWNPYEKLTDEAKANAQTQVDEVYQQFLKAVARGREVSVATVRSDFGEGRTVMARDAKAAGMIDRVGTLDELVARVSAKGTTRARMRAEDDVLELAIQAADATARDLDWLRL